MANTRIPLRPLKYNKTAIDKNIADCLTYCVLTGCKNEDAFRLFHPEYLDSTGKLSATGKRASRQFFSYARNKEYMDEYAAELDKFLKTNHADTNGIEVIDESRKNKALQSLLSQAMNLVEGGADLDADSLKTVSDIFVKLKLIKQEEITEEAPRRYIPISCNSCDYKKFIDEHIANGDIEKY